MEYLRVLVFACLVAACVSQEGGTNGTTGGSENQNQNGNFNFGGLFDMFGGNLTQLAQFFGGNDTMIQNFINSMQNLNAGNASFADVFNGFQNFQGFFPNATFADFANFLGGTNSTNAGGFADLAKSLQTLNITNLPDFLNTFNLTNASMPDIQKALGGLANGTVGGLQSFFDVLTQMNGPNSTINLNDLSKFLNGSNAMTGLADSLKNMGSIMGNNTSLLNVTKKLDQLNNSFKIGNMTDFAKITDGISKMFANSSMSMGDMSKIMGMLGNLSMGNFSMANMTSMLGNMGQMSQNMPNITNLMNMMTSMGKVFGNNTSFGDGMKGLTNFMNMNSSLGNMNAMNMTALFDNMFKSMGGSMGVDKFNEMLSGMNATTLFNMFNMFNSNSGGGMNLGNMVNIINPANLIPTQRPGGMWGMGGMMFG